MLCVYVRITRGAKTFRRHLRTVTDEKLSWHEFCGIIAADRDAGGSLMKAHGAEGVGVELQFRCGR